MDRVADPDLEDPNPDVWELFRHYDGLYFRGALAGAGFGVQWSSPRITGYFGSCTFRKTDNTITLSEPVLKYRSNADLKNALLHMMIHAILYVKLGTKDRWNHGPIFRAWMDAINSCPFEDHQRPRGGYNITTRHDFSPEESCSIQGFLWKCESCGDTLLRATKLGPPSDACCIENVDSYTTCGNILCHWHKHKMNCGDTYANEGMVSKPRETPGRKKVPKGTQRLLTDTSEMSKSQRTVQESDSAELQENATVRKPNAEGKLLSLVGVKNAKSLGSTSSKKAGKRHRPENVQKASVLPADPLRKLKLKQECVGSEKHELFSLVGRNDAKSSSTSEKARKRHKPENVQKSSVPPVAPQKKLKLKQDLVASQKHEVSSLVGYSNVKSSGSSTSSKVVKQHKPEGVKISSVPPAAPQEKLKLKQDLVASEKHKVSSLVGYSNAKQRRSSTSNKVGKHHKPEGVLPAAPPRKLKQHLLASEKNELFSRVGCSNAKVLGSSSKKAGKQHEPEDIQKTIALPAPHSKLKKANGISSSNKAGKQHKPEDIQKTGLVASQKDELYSIVGCSNAKVLDSSSKKEFAVISAWLNYYESEGSSGSTESLVNKRTERRKRARHHSNQITYSRSRKRNTRGGSSIKTQPPEDSSQQSQPRSPCLDIVILPADLVVTQAPGVDQSQPPAPCLDIVDVTGADQMVPLQSTDPPCSTPSNPSIGPDVIDISDDD